MKMINRCFFGLIICCVFGVLDASAAAKVMISKTSEGVYSVTVADVTKAAAIDFTISYDKDTLSTPVIVDGPFAKAVKAMAIPNNDVIRGTLRVVYVTVSKDTFDGGGLLATVTFNKRGDTNSRQPEFKAEIVSMDGVLVAAQPIVTPITEPVITDEGNIVSKSDNQNKQNTENTSTTSAINTPQYTTTIGSVTLPQEVGSKNDLVRQDSRIEERREEPQYQNDSANSGGNSQVPREVTAAVAVPEVKSVAAHPVLKSSQSVLDRFRAYKEIRNAKRLVKLFDESSLHKAGIVQTPAIVVTDGKSHATISIDLATVADTPSFSLKGANLKSIRRLSNNKWELDALPQKGKADVRLSIILKGTSAEIPLVVVPPLIPAGAALVVLSESALDGLLAKSQKNSKPVYDLNSDGKQDYFDDYILLAHWLLKHQKGTSETGQKKKPAAASK